MEPTFPAWGLPYLQAFEQLHCPVFLGRTDRTFLWANRAAESAFAPMKAQEVFHKLIFCTGFSTNFDFILQNQSFSYCADPSLGLCYDFLASPLLSQDGKVQGFILTPDLSAPNAFYGANSEQMLSVFSHQTRNPLSSIFSSLSGLSSCSEALESPEIRAYVKRIAEQGYRLLRTSVNITELYRLEHGTASFCPARQDLCLFLQQICKVISLMIEGIGIRFSCTFPTQPVIARFDADKVAVALLHLISNAAKYIAEKGTIHIALEVSAQRATITVADNGLGIPSSVLPRVFDPYFSFDPRTEAVCGDGLGLPICRIIARMHGGTAAVESREGEGTTAAFSISLNEDGTGDDLSVSDLPTVYLNNRFSDMHVILSDVCPPPDLTIGYY